MHDIDLIFHDFPGPLLFSITFQAWKLVCLNSITFHDFPGPMVTLQNYPKHYLSRLPSIKNTATPFVKQHSKGCTIHQKDT